MPHGKPKATAEMAADSGVLGRAIGEGFALAEPPISSYPRTLILEDLQRTALRSSGHSDFSYIIACKSLNLSLFSLCVVLLTLPFNCDSYFSSCF